VFGRLTDQNNLSGQFKKEKNFRETNLSFNLTTNFCTEKWSSTIPSEWVAAGFSLRLYIIAFLSLRNLKVAAT